jgi:hypothetical protein
VCQRLATDAIAVGRKLVWFQCTECRTVWRASRTNGSTSPAGRHEDEREPGDDPDS